MASAGGAFYEFLDLIKIMIQMASNRAILMNDDLNAVEMQPALADCDCVESGTGMGSGHLGVAARNRHRHRGWSRWRAEK